MLMCDFAYEVSILSFSVVVANHGRYVAMHKLIIHIINYLAVMQTIKSKKLVEQKFCSKD